MNVNKHTKNVKRITDYLTKQAKPTAIQTKTQFLKLMAKASATLKAVGTQTFISLAAATAWAIVNAGYTSVVGGAAWTIQAIAHSLIDFADVVVYSAKSLVSKSWSLLNKVQKVLTKRDLPLVSEGPSMTEHLAAVDKRKAAVDRFCESGVRFMMRKDIRITLLIWSTVLVAPMVISLATGGLFFAQTALATTALIAVWSTVVLELLIFTRIIRQIERKRWERKLETISTDNQSRIEYLEGQLEEAIECILTHEKITNRHVKRSGTGYMRKQQKPARA